MAINYPVIFKTDTSALDKAGGSLKKFGGIAAGVGAAAGAAIAGIAVTSIKEFAKFDSALNKSISIMGDVSDTLQDDMAQAAKDVAKTTSFSAEQAAESYFFLASAGLDAAASVEAMPQVAAFAQAGMFDMATATDLATDAQSALGLASDDAGENLDNLTRVTDVFVAANTLANTSVEQLAAAMTSKAGNALKTVGKDIEEGSAALAVFADQGIKGEKAGTLLTNTLFGLTDNAQKNAGAFKDLGIEVFEADGSMKNMSDIANDVTNAFDGMSQEQKLAEISALGFTKQTREGVLALVDNGDTLAEYEEALRNAGGTAGDVAENQMDTLTAQFGLLKDNVNVAGIEIGAKFEGPLKDLLKAINPIIDMAAPAFIGFFGNIADGVGVVADKLNKFVEILPLIKEDFELVQASGEGFKGFLDLLGNIFENLFGSVDFGSVFQTINAMIMQLRLAIIDAIPGIIEGLVEFIPQFISFITDTLIPQMLANMQMILPELIAMIKEVLPMLAEGIGDLIPALVQGLADLLPVIVETILGFIPTLLDIGLDLFNSIVDALVEMIPQIIDTLVELLPKLVATLMEMLPQIIEAGLDLFMGIVNALVETIPVILDAIVEAMPQITEQLILMLPTLIEAALELFFGIVTGLVESIPKILTAIIEMIPEITAQMIEMLPDIVEAAVDLFFGIIEGLVEATPEILGAIIELIPKITGALIGELPKLLEAGFQILVGIKDGIMNNLSRIASDIASSIFNAIEGGVKGIFGIASPSKEMMKIGEELSAGLAEGIKDTEGLAVGASLQMASRVQIASENAIVPNRPPSLGGFDSGSAPSSAGSNINITVNTGVGTDPVAVGREVVNAIKRYESTNGKVFATA